MPEPEQENPVTKFYTPIMQERSKEVQGLLIDVLRDEFAQPGELVAAITAAAERSGGAGEGVQ